MIALAVARPVWAEPPRPRALVIANSNYTTLPKLPGCALSANLVSTLLSRAGFAVTRQNDLSNARLGTSIAALGEDAAAAAGGRALIYICTHVVSYADRLFILPVEVRLDRDSDVLSQGIVARLLMASVAGPSSAAGLVLMDVATPTGAPPPDFAPMRRPPDAAHGGLAAAAIPAADATGPAPLATALGAAIGTGPLEIGALLSRLSADPALRRAVLTVQPPSQPSWLSGEPAPEPKPALEPAPPPASAPIVPPAAAPAAAPVAAPPDPGSALADPNPAERRRIQLSLSKLGYYGGGIDGQFGLDTALAIRRYQRDSNSEATGKLTARQMEQLLQ